ncbi:MAG: hypothetical protein CMB80_07430 [Flammeovirgaceae bacterium]|nr:hypothetical protein [Flammeovirgaceae bacterium]MBE62983.1 hypothetical protein [Flammeovirgaceae bacterium]|tara:strand:+ start:7719 stop:9425 length:1707 start_codon:yes stop_codon:yes gene_type:complete
MKLIIKSLVIIILFEILSYGCANPISPTGGIKDTIPPTLLESNPVDQQLNFEGQTITLWFDEIISADKITSNLVITPTTETKYKTVQKKYSVSLQFEEPFDDSTTYTFNFFDGITDITEKNPAENLILAFSTGNYIDSLYLSGQVIDLLTGEPQDKITVGLYNITDSLDFQTTKPTYFSTTDKSGNFYLQNIKASNFRMFAFGDENRNLIFDAATESYAIYSDTLNMRLVSGDTVNLSSIKIDASELNFISARPSGLYFDLRYSKPITSYQYHNSDSVKLATKLIDENKTIRVYDNKSFTDSLFSIFYVRDSLGNQSSDSTYIKFRESSRKPEQYNLTLQPGKGSQVTSDTRYTIEFNKPSFLIVDDFLDVVYDTLLRFNYQPSFIKYDKHNNSISFSLNIDNQSLTDSLNSIINSIQIDTTNIDSVQLALKNKLSTIPTSSFNIEILPKSFVSVELDSSTTITNGYKFLKTESQGVIRVNMVTDSTHYLVQVMNKSEAVQTMSNCTQCVFNNLNPGKYWIRVLIDSNKNGIWDIGNYRENIAPEPVIYFKEETTLRANFDNSLEYSF